MNGPKVGDECVENHKNERKVRTVLEDGVEDVQESPQDEINEVNDEEEDNTESLNNSDEDDNDEGIEKKVKELELDDIKEEEEEQEVLSEKGKDGFYAKKQPYYTQLEKCSNDSPYYFINNPNLLKCGMGRGAPTYL